MTYLLIFDAALSDVATAEAKSSCDLQLMQYPGSIFKSRLFLKNNFPTFFVSSSTLDICWKKIQVDATKQTN
jgi:hypothetical protein